MSFRRELADLCRQAAEVKKRNALWQSDSDQANACFFAGLLYERVAAFVDDPDVYQLQVSSSDDDTLTVQNAVGNTGQN